MIIATPGRLLNLINENACTLAHVSYIVLDEADRMLDMGFEPDIRAIMALVKPSTSRQTLMVSATWPETIQKLAHEFIRNPLQICIGNLEQENTTNKNIKQIVEVMEDRARDQRLIQLLKQHHTRANPQKMLIFVLYKKEVDRIERLINQNGFSCRGISSDKTQADRSRAIEDFKANKLLLLVATDVAARGLDIDNVMIVINYSFPLTIEDYVHRIGRTGRGGKSGTAITFFCRNEKHLAGELVNVLTEAGETVPPELLKFGIGIKKKKHGMYGDHFKNDDRPMKQATKITFD
jgi:ATP-dependent RNA helicase DBP3